MSNFQEHLDELARKFDCKITFDRNQWLWMPKKYKDDPTGAAYSNSICIYRWRDNCVKCYFAGLHELGHFHFQTNGDNDKYRKNVIHHECEAWEWAINNSEIELTEEMIEYMKSCLSSYIKDRFYFNFGKITSFADSFLKKFNLDWEYEADYRM